MYRYFFKINPLCLPKPVNRMILMVSISVILLLVSAIIVFSQNNTLVLNGAFLKMSGGSSGTPLYLVVNQNNPLGMVRNSGAIITQDGNEYNYLKWNMRTATGNFEFPFGTASAYFPFKFSKTTSGTESGTGSLTVSSWYTAANAFWPSGTSLCGLASENDVTDRFWVITPSGYSANPTADVSFYYNAASELDGNPVETDLLMQRWNNSCCGASTCKWETPPVGTVYPASDYVLVSGLNSFSPWAMTRQGAPLPIELLYFRAHWKDQQYTAVKLEWKTAVEINNEHFEVQRSLDAVNFATIKIVPGAGNSSQVISYNDYDTEPEKEVTSFYRLKQVDYDGSYTFSNIEALNPPAGVNLITIYPNPSSDFLDYLVYSADDTQVSVWAIDAAGKVVFAEKKELKKGLNQERLNINHLSSGSYILQITANKETKTEKQFVIK